MKQKPRIFSFFDTADVDASSTADITFDLTKQYNESTKVRLQQVTGYRETDDVTVTAVNLKNQLNKTLTALFQNAVQTSSEGNRIPVDDEGTLGIHGELVVTVANAEVATAKRVSVGLVLKEILDE